MPLRSRRPDAFHLPSQCAGHDGLERENAALRAALAEALGCLRFVPHPGHSELDCWRGVMAPAVHQRLSELAATREGT